MRPSGRAPDQMRALTFEPGFTRHAEAVTSTRVSPKLTRQLPSACRVKPGSNVNARIWSGARPLGRMQIS